MRLGRSSTTLVLSGLVLSGLLAGLAVAAPASALEVGDKAPDFTLPAPGGKQVKLSELTAKGPVSSSRSFRPSPAPERRRSRASTRPCRSSKP
jgi:hypothetical protein